MDILLLSHVGRPAPRRLAGNIRARLDSGTTDRWRQAGAGWTSSRRLETCRTRGHRVNWRNDDGFKTWIIPERYHVACEGPLTRMRPLQGRRVGFCWAGPDGEGRTMVALSCALQSDTMSRSCRKLQCDAMHSPIVVAMAGTCLSAWWIWSSASCPSRLRDRIDFEDFELKIMITTTIIIITSIHSVHQLR